jgi:DNA-binding MarR family transcriptional regulator
MRDDVPELYLENQLCFPLYAASRLTTKLYAPYLEELGLTYPQYLVMLTLWEEDAQSVRAIGRRLYLESNTLTPLLKRLQQKGLIDRTRSTKDERTVVISLTTAGAELRERARQVPGDIVTSFQDETVDEGELQRFQRTLFRLLEVLSKRAGE